MKLTTILNLTALLLFILYHPASPAATYYVCPGQGEHEATLLSDQPCQAGGQTAKQGENKITLPDNISRSDTYIIDPLQRYRLEQKYDRQTPDRRSVAYERSEPVRRAECVAATRSLEAWRAHLKSGYTLSESETMHEELRRRLVARDEACR